MPNKSETTKENAQEQPQLKVENVSQPSALNELSAQVQAKKDKEDAVKIPPAKIFKLYVLPLATLVIFAGIWLALIFPNISSAFTLLNDMAAYKTDVEDAQDKLADLQVLQAEASQINTDLDLINQVAPVEATKVVEFQQKITQLATQNSLTLVEASTENQELVLEENVSAALAIIEIPSRFVVRGSFNAIRSFIEAIDSLEDFVIIGEMQLKSTTEIDTGNLPQLYSGQWSLTIDLIKYQFLVPDEENELQQAYTRVPASVLIDSEVMEFVRGKYSN